MGPNTVVYRYPARAQPRPIEKENLQLSDEENSDSYEYPPMRTLHGAVLPFEIIFDGSVNSEQGNKAQENYYKHLTVKPEQNKIIYQDLETTRERLNAAGIYDAQDLSTFDMPLIAKIVGAGVLITSKITVDAKKTDASLKNNSTSLKEYNTKVILNIYDKNGKAVFTKTEAPYSTTTIDSYQTTLDYVMKQTPYYHK